MGTGVALAQCPCSIAIVRPAGTCIGVIKEPLQHRVPQVRLLLCRRAQRPQTLQVPPRLRQCSPRLRRRATWLLRSACGLSAASSEEPFANSLASTLLPLSCHLLPRDRSRALKAVETVFPSPAGLLGELDSILDSRMESSSCGQRASAGGGGSASICASEAGRAARDTFSGRASKRPSGSTQPRTERTVRRRR
eukprot:3493773-Rhodomonas_salina.1